jgi:hypothetical protein
MARSVLLSTIADRARYMADQRNSNFTSDAEMLSIINDNYTELYDELVASNENYYTTTANLTLVAGTSSYALAADFYKIIGIDFAVSGSSYVTLKPYMEAERNQSLTTSTAIPSGTVRVRYVPAPTTFTALSQSVDGVAGWDRLLTLMVAMEMLDSEESDTKNLQAKYARTLDRIQTMAQNRDQGMPGRVVDIYSANNFSMYGSLKYRLYSNNIEFISTEFLGGDLVAPYF